MRATEVSIANFLSADEIEAMARESGFVKRRSPVTGMRFLVTFTTGLLNTPDGTLAQLAAFLPSTRQVLAREVVGVCGGGVSRFVSP